jgi:MFS family permease
VLSIDSLVVRRVETRSRGALASALRRGLFAASFGPNYYRGFVDSSTEMVSVDFGASRSAGGDLAAESSGTPTKIVDRWVVSGYAASAALGAVAVGFGVLAGRASDEYNATTIERSATDASARFERDRSLAITTGVAAAIAASATTWLVWRRSKARPRRNSDLVSRW